MEGPHIDLIPKQFKKVTGAAKKTFVKMISDNLFKLPLKNLKGNKVFMKTKNPYYSKRC